MNTNSFKFKFLIVFWLTVPAFFNLAAAEETITINGLSGEITIGFPIPVLYGGDTLTVKIVNADRIHYDYSIDPGTPEKLVQGYPVTGLDPLLGNSMIPGGTQPTEGSGVTTDGHQNQPSPAGLPDYDDLMKDYRDYVQRTADLEGEIGKAVQPVIELQTPLKILPVCKDSGIYPSRYKKISEDFIEKHLPKLYSEASGLKRDFQKLLTSLDLLTWSLLTKDPEAPIAHLSTISNKTVEKINHINGLTDGLKPYRDFAVRALWILQNHPEPEINKKFKIRQENARYTVIIQRQATTSGAQALIRGRAESADGSKKESPQNNVTEIIASFTYEVHTRTRLSFHMGLAGFLTPDQTGFSIQPLLVEDNPDTERVEAVTYEVRESKSERWEVKPVATLGVLLSKDPIDIFGQGRKAIPMVTLGSELSSSPKRFLLGGALDFKGGYTLGLGLTHYRRTELAEGWQIGSAVPLKPGDNGMLTNDPLIAEPPTTEKDGLGFYVNLGIRPVVFEKIWQKIKGN